MTQLVADIPRPANLGDRYLLLLLGVLAGYAMFGKGFAYVGVPPLFIGEVVFLSGFVLVLRMGGVMALFATGPALVLAAMMLWTLFRTLPFIAEYRFDAPRDSVIIMYGGFAFITTALLLDDPRRLDMIVRRYTAFLDWFVPTLAVLFAVCHYLRNYLPNLPGTTVPVIMLGPAEVPVHLVGAAVFTMAGFRKATPLWIVALVAGTIIASVLTRGGMLAFVVPMAVAVLALGKLRQMVQVVAVGGAILALAYAVETATGLGTSTVGGAERPLSATQIVKNVQSLAGAKDPILEGSREWRLEWWRKIIDDTVFGERFWTGRGYGINLALAYGYGDPKDSEPLRSPHNAHMTILARGGIPGIALWALFLASWGLMMTNAFFAARRRRDEAWAGLFLWVGCYAGAVVVNASFDVALEGPMQGVWFWCLIGMGFGMVMIFRAQGRAGGYPERTVT